MIYLWNSETLCLFSVIYCPLFCCGRSFFEELGLTFNEEDICCPQAGILQSPPCFTRFCEDPIDSPSKWYHQYFACPRNTLYQPLAVCLSVCLSLVFCFMSFCSASVCVCFSCNCLRPIAVEGGFHMKQRFIIVVFYKGKNNWRIGYKLSKTHRSRATTVIIFGWHYVYLWMQAPDFFSSYYFFQYFMGIFEYTHKNVKNFTVSTHTSRFCH